MLTTVFFVVFFCSDTRTHIWVKTHPHDLKDTIRNSLVCVQTQWGHSGLYNALSHFEKSSAAWLLAELLLSQSPCTEHACMANTIRTGFGILLPPENTALSSSDVSVHYIRLWHGRQTGVFLIMASTVFVQFYHNCCRKVSTNSYLLTEKKIYIMKTFHKFGQKSSINVFLINPNVEFATDLMSISCTPCMNQPQPPLDNTCSADVPQLHTLVLFMSAPWNSLCTAHKV